MDWIIKYWVEAAFGVVIAGITFLFRHYIKLNKKEQETERAAFRVSLTKDITSTIKTNFDTEFQKSIQRDIEINDRLDDIDEALDTLTAGVLSVQKREFIHDGQRLLNKEYITFEDMQALDDEYKIYGSLGGNSSGDSLFNLIKKKFESQIEKRNSSSELEE